MGTLRAQSGVVGSQRRLKASLKPRRQGPESRLAGLAGTVEEETQKGVLTSISASAEE